MADTKRNIAAILEPYRNQRGKLQQQLGDSGLRMLAELCDQSPTSMAEFLGFGASGRQNMRKTLQRIGLDTKRRDPHDPHNMSLEDWEAHYLRLTDREEHAVEADWKLPAKHPDEFGRLHFLGDLHIGNTHLDAKSLRRFIGWLANRPFDRWILLGDLFELRTKSSPGEPPVLPVSIAMEIACKWLEPIMPQCIVAHCGNHDLRVARQTDVDWEPVKELAKRFSIPYGTMDGFHVLTISRGKASQRYVGYCHHGYGAARTPGARRNQLVSKLNDTNADYLAMAHLHDQDAGGKPVFGPDETGSITSWDKPVVRTGSWLKHLAGSYAREAGMPPGHRGAVTLHLYTSKHSVHTRS